MALGVVWFEIFIILFIKFRDLIYRIGNYRSFAAWSCQRGGRSDFVELIFFTIIGFFVSQNHCGFSCVFRVVIPNWFFSDRISFFFVVCWVDFLFLELIFGVSEDDVALIVIGDNTYVYIEIPVGGRLVWFLESFCHPKDQLDWLARGLCLVGLEMKELLLDVSCPAGGRSSI